jgi:hypothetical protein
MDFIVKVIEGKICLAEESDSNTAFVSQEEYEAIDKAANYEIVDGALVKIQETLQLPLPVIEKLSENEVRVKVVEGTVYLASDASENTAIITKDEWESIDKKKEYAVINGNLIEYDDTPIEPQKPAKPTLDVLYDSEGCGLREQVNALWLAISGDKSEYERIEELRNLARERYKAL